jgi:hypothetical protein
MKIAIRQCAVCRATTDFHIRSFPTSFKTLDEATPTLMDADALHMLGGATDQHPDLELAAIKAAGKPH